MRVVALCLLGLCALAIPMAASAWAEDPAWYQCGHADKEVVTYESNGKLKHKSVYTGRYTDKGCSQEAPPGELREGGAPEGKYEFEEWRLGSKATGGKDGKVKKFKAKGALYGTVDIPGVSTVECSHTSEEGEVTGPKAVGDLEVTLTGCKASSEPCQNGATGEIKSNTLAGEIGYLSKARHTVGIDLMPQAAGSVVEFHCGIPPTPILRVRVTGSIVGEVTPVNMWSKEMTIHYEQSGGVQHFRALEGLPEDVLQVEYCKSREVCEPFESIEAAVGARLVSKGEELYLKA
jgi:hypothetical protein